MEIKAYYNEIDSYACAWLSNLMDAGLIMPGVIDDRSIEDIDPSELEGFIRHHFFAGIGGWDVALQLAGWPKDKPVWTGSCPCQPFSVAGRGEGKADKRHLWPAWARLIKECKPDIIFGEQVTGAITKGWLDDVSDDLEKEGYAFGPGVLPACSIGRPHRRYRIWFVAHSDGKQIYAPHEGGLHSEFSAKSAGSGIMGDPDFEWKPQPEGPFGIKRGWPVDPSQIGPMVNAAREPKRESNHKVDAVAESREARGLFSGSGDRDIKWLECADGKFRPVEPGIRLLVNGIQGRVAIQRPIKGNAQAIEEHWYNRSASLKGFGNAIVPEVAAEFIIAANEAILDYADTETSNG